MALLWMANRFFDKVVAVTIDHRYICIYLDSPFFLQLHGIDKH